MNWEKHVICNERKQSHKRMLERFRILFKIAKKFFYKAIKGSLKCAISQGLNCGKGCVVSSGTDFGSEPFLITLHDNVRLSSNVSLITHDGSVHTLKQQDRYKKIPIHGYGKIEIDDNTFIGANAIILPNIYIGKNCIIGAGSVVTKSIPDNCVAAGVPARIIERTDEFATKKEKAMPSNWDENEYKKEFKKYLLKKIPNPSKSI